MLDETQNFLDEHQRALLAELLSASLEFDLRQYRWSTIERRVRHRMASNGIDTLDSYLGLVTRSTDEQRALAQDLCVSVTRFFRDPDVFSAIEPHVRSLVATFESRDVLRVWVPACATGEEAYSVAMVFLEAFRNEGREPSLVVYATDRDPQSVERARKGIYSRDIEGDVPTDLVTRYFEPVEEGYRVSTALRDPVSFAVHDLVTDPPFPQLHFVSCRNVLIYLQNEAQERVYQHLHFALQSDGLLLVGNAEDPGLSDAEFAVVDSHAHLFRRVASKEDVASSHDHERLNASENGQARVAGGDALEAELRDARKQLKETVQDLEAANEELLAANEEATAMNEELQAANEELEAAAEESRAANRELRQAVEQLAHRERQQRAIAELGIAALATTDLDSFLEMTANEVQRTLDVEFVKILETSPQTERFVLRAGTGWREGSVGNLSIGGGSESQAGYTLRAREVVFVESLATETRFSDLAMLEAHGITSGLSCPILDSRTPYGVLSVHTTYRRRFTEQESQFLRAVSTIIASALARARARLRQQLESIIARKIAQSFEIEDVMRSVAETLASHLSVDVCELWIRGTRPTDLGLHSVWTSEDERLAEISAVREFTPGVGLVGVAWQSQRAIWIDELNEDQIFKRKATAERLGLRTGFAFPLIGGGEVQAVCCCFSRKLVGADRALHADFEAVGRTLGEAMRRVTLQQEAAERGALTAAVLNQSLDAIVLIDEDGCLVEFNPTAETVFGYERAEVLGKGFADLMMPERFRDAHHHGMQRFRETGKPRIIGRRVELEALRKDGTEFPVELAVAPIETASGRLFAGFMRDLSQRHAADLALRESERRFRATFENAAVGVALVGLDGRWIRVNSRLAEITGYPLEVLAQKTFQDITHPDDLASDLALLERLVAGEIADYEMEKRYIRPDQSHVWVNLTVSLIRDQKEEPQLFIAVIEDITEKRRASEALHEASRQKDVFLAMLGHELRNPLSAIRNAVELMHMNSDLDPRLERAREVLDRQTKQMSRLLDGLLDVSRIVLGKASLLVAPVDMTALIHGAVQSTAFLCEEKGVRLDLDISEEPMWVNGDDARLLQIVDNLLSNAIKFTPRGGAITIGLAPIEGSIRLTVTDDGPGIEPSLLPHIFKPFRQAEQELARTSGGLGLGLAVVEGLTELHHGTVTVRSSSEAGTTFTVELPATTPPSHATTSDPEPEESSRRILIIEDNRDTADLFQQLLEALGHVTAVAYDGVSGLQLASQFRPEIVFCDIGLPGELDGFGVAKRMRATGEIPFKLVAVTGYGRDDDRRKGKEAGFDEFLTKPVDLNTIQRICDGG